MNIFHINCNYAGTILHEIMAKHLECLGVKNEIFVPVYKNRRVICELRENVHVVECFKKWHRFFFRLKQAKILSFAKRLFDIRSFQCIHAHTLFSDGNVALNLSKQFGVPYIVAIRSTDVDVFFRKRPDLRKRGLEIMRNATRIIFLSEAYKNIVCQKYVPINLRKNILDKSLVIPNGIDDFWFENNPNGLNRKIKKDVVRLIYAGRIEKRKNLPMIQNAMKILQEKGVITTLTIVGDIFDKKEYDNIKNNQSTICMPRLPKEKLIEQYRDHDIFIMPSFAETFGLVYAESLSQGLPIVYSKNEGFDGQFKEGLVGYHCDANDANDVAKSIEKIIENYDDVQGNCVKASSKFRWNDICEKYFDIYRMIANA